MEFGTREHAINAYRRIVRRWDDSECNLKEILPNKYKEICLKLDALESGKDYKIVDKTEELVKMIAYVGGQIPSINVKTNKKGTTYIDTSNAISYKEAERYAEELNQSLAKENKLWEVD